MGEAKSVGFDPKIIRKVIKLRKMDRDKRQEEEYLTVLYLSAIGEGPIPAQNNQPTTAAETPSETASSETQTEVNEQAA